MNMIYWELHMIPRRLLIRIPVTPIDGTVLKESDEFDILGETFDPKITFENHLRSVFRACSVSTAWYLEEVLASIP